MSILNLNSHKYFVTLPFCLIFLECINACYIVRHKCYFYEFVAIILSLPHKQREHYER